MNTFNLQETKGALLFPVKTGLYCIVLYRVSPSQRECWYMEEGIRNRNMLSSHTGEGISEFFWVVSGEAVETLDPTLFPCPPQVVIF